MCFLSIRHPLSGGVRAGLVNYWDDLLASGDSIVTNRDFFKRGKGSGLYELALDMCRDGHGIRPTRGSAIMWANVNASSPDLETIRTLHGACPVLKGAPRKNVLVKMVTDGKVRHLD